MTLSHQIAKPVDYIFDYLTDMQKFVSVHPVISKMDKNENGSYLVHETLKLGPIPFSFTYPATINAFRQENMVVMSATVMKSIKIEMRFTLTPDHDHTIVEENISFKPWVPITSIMQRIFRKQHEQLFKNIEMTK